MLRVENGVLIMDDNEYWQAVVYNLRPNVPITIKILEGSTYISAPTSEGNYGPGDSVVVQVESTGDQITVGKDTSATARFLITYEVEASVASDLYEQKAIVPAAVSSQLDVTGEERIHIAPYEEKDNTPAPAPVEKCSYIFGTYGYSEGELVVVRESNVRDMPSWFAWGESQFLVRFADEPDVTFTFMYDYGRNRYYTYRYDGYYDYYWPVDYGQTRYDAQIAMDRDEALEWSCLHVEEDGGGT